MPISRRDMLMDAERPKPPISEQKLAKNVDDGGAYISLKGNPGWNKLMQEFIEPALNLNALWAIPDEDLPLHRAKMKALKELVDFVDKKVNDAVKAFETLQKTGGNNNG